MANYVPYTDWLEHLTLITLKHLQGNKNYFLLLAKYILKEEKPIPRIDKHIIDYDHITEISLNKSWITICHCAPMANFESSLNQNYVRNEIECQKLIYEDRRLSGLWVVSIMSIVGYNANTLQHYV